tara:strand:+ start:294 stop:722 length:429 start_codon:yes stop_codon:yes gene_type:complete
MKTKSFRGKLSHAGVETIRLSTNDGLTGYKVVKFQVMAQDPNEDLENSVKIFTVPQTSASVAVNFNDPTLLACCMIWSNTSQVYVHESNVIFDNMIFNQDIYITNFDTAASGSINYYIELEQVKLGTDEAAVATLKDMRGRE